MHRYKPNRTELIQHAIYNEQIAIPRSNPNQIPPGNNPIRTPHANNEVAVCSSAITFLHSSRRTGIFSTSSQF
jgi:hypothetical protein